MTLRPPRSTLFPYTTRFRSVVVRRPQPHRVQPAQPADHVGLDRAAQPVEVDQVILVELGHEDPAVQPVHEQDRKSTRLNSSHANISYAVFCLKKKQRKITRS